MNPFFSIFKFTESVEYVVRKLIRSTRHQVSADGHKLQCTGELVSIGVDDKNYTVNALLIAGNETTVDRNAFTDMEFA